MRLKEFHRWAILMLALMCSCNRILGSDKTAPVCGNGQKETGELCDNTGEGIDSGCTAASPDCNSGCSECSGGAPPPGMAAIPGGCLNMGNDFGEMDSRPVHNVCLASFKMDIHEVNNGEYAACVRAGVCSEPGSKSSATRQNYWSEYGGDSDFPVIHVDWDQAKAYCAWEKKRLPTEAEWEYAARGGLPGKPFPWESNDISKADANFNSDPRNVFLSNFLDTSQGCRYPPNRYGLCDMAGNVWEWTNDWYAADYYGSSPVKDPQGPESGENRVVRGGSWGSIASEVRVDSRGKAVPTTQKQTVGFRCVKD